MAACLHSLQRAEVSPATAPPCLPGCRSVSTILTGLQSFMSDTAHTTGAVSATPEDRRHLATESLAYNVRRHGAGSVLVYSVVCWGPRGLCHGSVYDSGCSGLRGLPGWQH